jgi:hypothetical protein
MSDADDKTLTRFHDEAKRLASQSEAEWRFRLNRSAARLGVDAKLLETAIRDIVARKTAEAERERRDEKKAERKEQREERRRIAAERRTQKNMRCSVDC